MDFIEKAARAYQDHLAKQDYGIDPWTKLVEWEREHRVEAMREALKTLPQFDLRR
jgi:hypothetical protein